MFPGESRGPAARLDWAPAFAGERSGGRSAEQGFTLIEMLVALAIFSLAALALLRLEGATVSNTARLQDQAIAEIVARNIAVETATDPAAPALGETSGETVNGGRAWRWRRTVALSPESRIQLVTIAVEGQNGPSAATLTIFRKGEQ
ncbi:MAG TPA: type II secretion system minor pseudopilin GspI [Allosphingosinicella sp.]